MAINLKSRVAGASRRLEAFINQLVQTHTDELKAEFSKTKAEHEVRWDSIEKELLPDKPIKKNIISFGKRPSPPKSRRIKL